MIRQRRLLVVLAALAANPLALAAQQRVATPPPVAESCSSSSTWNEPQAPFRIYGNTYFVGTHCLSAILVTSPAGHVLIDAGLPTSAPQVLASIAALGFKVSDIKLLLNSHPHYDHSGGLAEVQRVSGAAAAASPASARALEAGASGPDDPQFGALPDFPRLHDVRVIADRDTVRVGPLALVAYWTPGHTPGGTSWGWTSCEGARCVTIVYADSQSPISADGFSFTHSTSYPAALRDFAAGQTTLEQMPCGILVTPHPSASQLWERLAARQAGKADALIDATACRRYAEGARAQLARRVATETDASH